MNPHHHHHHRRRRGRSVRWMSGLCALVLATLGPIGLAACGLTAGDSFEFIPDDETELYFKAADALVLPYTHVFQSGVLFLSYNFGLPVIAADVASMTEDIIEGETGYIFQPKNAEDLATKIEAYFTSPLYKGLIGARSRIKHYAANKYSWTKVAKLTNSVYGRILDST